MGGLHLAAADLDSLANAAKGVAAGYPEKRQHVFGVVIVMLRDDEFAAAIEHRIVPNPHYTGTWKLEYSAELQRP